MEQGNLQAFVLLVLVQFLCVFEEMVLGLGLGLACILVLLLFFKKIEV
jgi:hypothetical protein